jgi:NTE family protein
MSPPRDFSLVLGGGGLKGLAHIGVLQALEEAGLQPKGVVGSSIGSLIAAAWASGHSVGFMRERALRLRRKDVFRVAHTDMALKRMHSPAVYRPEPLDTLIHEMVGERTFDELAHPLVVNTVDINSGAQVLWGLPGLRYVPVADTVFASCALPGILPPREIAGRWYVDGAVADNLPVKAATACGPGPIVGVNVSASLALRSDVEKSGFATTYARGLEIVMETMLERTLRAWRAPPLLMVHPRVEDYPMFVFDRTQELMAEGYRAMRQLVPELLRLLETPEEGIFPKTPVRIHVDRARCIGCSACALRAPNIFRMDAQGKAEVVAPQQAWSPLDGVFIRNCPTWAISARPVGEWSGSHPLPIAASPPSPAPS